MVTIALAMKNVKWVGDGRGVGGGNPPRGWYPPPLCEVGGWYPPLMHHFYLSKEVDIPPPRHYFKKKCVIFFSVLKITFFNSRSQSLVAWLENRKVSKDEKRILLDLNEEFVREKMWKSWVKSVFYFFKKREKNLFFWYMTMSSEISQCFQDFFQKKNRTINKKDHA